ncbi:MAG: hypothetical protein HQL37_03445 [Alphaproteobacteria bacterium]|nr:hypothetical protein [Alphaproteobacteria bacterium]
MTSFPVRSGFWGRVAMASGVVVLVGLAPALANGGGHQNAGGGYGGYGTGPSQYQPTPPHSGGFRGQPAHPPRVVHVPPRVIHVPLRPSGNGGGRPREAQVNHPLPPQFIFNAPLRQDYRPSQETRPSPLTPSPPESYSAPRPPANPTPQTVYVPTPTQTYISAYVPAISMAPAYVPAPSPGGLPAPALPFVVDSSVPQATVMMPPPLPPASPVATTDPSPIPPVSGPASSIIVSSVPQEVAPESPTSPAPISPPSVAVGTPFTSPDDMPKVTAAPIMAVMSARDVLSELPPDISAAALP